MISRKAIKEIVKATVPDTQITASAIEMIQNSSLRYIKELVREAVDEQGAQNDRLKACNIPPEKRLDVNHFRNAERKILPEGKNV